MSYTRRPIHIIHLSYNVPRPRYSDPEAWLDRVAHTRGVAEKLLLYGPQTVIYNIDYKGEIKRNGVDYIFSGGNWFGLKFPFAFNRRVRRLNPDIVLCHGLIFPWQIIVLRMIVGPSVKIICQHHAERPFRDLRRYLARWADRSIAGYLFASKTQGEEWVAAAQIASLQKVHEVMGTSSIFRADLSRKKQDQYLWIGDLDENKDPMTVVKAFVAFSNNHPHVQLNMIFQNDRFLPELKAIANKNIHFVGPLVHSSLQEYFNRATYVISTSHYEGSGIAVCEALSCGCFPILTDIPSFRMMTDNGKIGRLFAAGNHLALAEALEETKNISGSGKVIAHFEAELSFEANARKIINIINSL